ncbi:N/A [soil metagenome]
MKVSVAKSSGSVVQMNIAADDDEFSKAMNQAYRRVVKEFNIPGFRKGKAPRHIVERMLGRDALVEEAGMGIMDELYRRALEQEGLTPVSEPEVNVLEPEPIAFQVVVQVYPEITLGDYKSIRVEPREVNLEDGAVDETVDRLRKNAAEWVDLPKPRKPADGDQVTIDMTVYDGDEIFQEPAEDMPWVLGEAGMFEALEEAIKTMDVGDATELTLAFEEDDETVAPEVRGTTLRYEMTLKGIKERDLPELDAEFAGKIGGLESIDELRSEIRKDLLREKATEARTDVLNEIVNAMAEASEVDVPVAMVDAEIDSQVTQMSSRLAQSGMDLETFLEVSKQTEAEFRDEMRPDAERRVRNSLVMQQITEAESLSITPADIEEEISRLTGGMENSERMRSIYESDYFRERLLSEVQDRKLTDRIIEIATDGRGALAGEAADLLAEDAEAQAVAADSGVIEVSGEEEDQSAPISAEAHEAGEVEESEAVSETEVAVAEISDDLEQKAVEEDENEKTESA